MGLLDMLKQQALGGQWGASQAMNPTAMSSPMGAQPQAPQPPPQAPPQAPQGLMSRIGEFGKEHGMQMAAIFNGMRMDPDPYISQQASQQNLLRYKDKKEAKQANATADWLEKQGASEMAEMVRQNPALGSQMLLEYQKAKLKDPKETYQTVSGTQLRDLGYNVDDGIYNMSSTGKITGTGGGVNIDMGTDKFGSIPAGHELYDTPGGGKAMRPVPGSPAAMEAKAVADKTAGRGDQTAAAGTTVIQDLQRMGDLIPDFAVQSDGDTGYLGNVGGAVSRAALSEVPGTPEHQAMKFKEAALSNVGIDQLMQIKSNSATGGGLGQVPFQQQKRLESLLGSLDLTQGTDVLKDNINRIQNAYTDIVHGTRRDRKDQLKAGEITQGQFNAVESLYKPLSFDKQGRPIDTSKVPPGFPTDKYSWDQVPEELRLKLWTRVNANDGY